MSAWLLAMVLLVFVGAHVALCVSLLRATRARWRGIVALVAAPLAPYWAWQEGKRKRVYVWTAALVTYAVGTALFEL